MSPLDVGRLEAREGRGRRKLLHAVSLDHKPLLWGKKDNPTNTIEVTPSPYRVLVCVRASTFYLREHRELARTSRSSDYKKLQRIRKGGKGVCLCHSVDKHLMNISYARHHTKLEGHRNQRDTMIPT